MLIENCPFHLNNLQNIIIDSQPQSQLICSDCFSTYTLNQYKTGVFFNQNTLNFFFRWNQYLIEQLASIKNIVAHQGFNFLLKNTSLNIEDQKINEEQKRCKGTAEPKQILLYVISEHMNLLRQNMACISQSQKIQDLHNPVFLKDIFTIVSKTIQQILKPVKDEFCNILNKQFDYLYQYEWKIQVINYISTIRDQILNDWAKNCIINKQVIKEEQKTQNESNSRLQTQNTLNKSEISGDQLSFQEDQEINLIGDQGFEYSQIQNNQLFNEESFQKTINELRKQNQELKSLLNQKDLNIQKLNQKLKLIQKETQGWVFKHKELQQKYQKLILEKIPLIQNQIQQLNYQMQSLIDLSEQQDKFIGQLKKNILKFKQENDKLKTQKKNTCMDSVYEKQNQKLLQEVVQLEAINMQKDHDIKIVISSLQMTRKMLTKLKNQQPLINSNQLNTQWQKLIIPRLKSLYIIRLNPQFLVS